MENLFVLRRTFKRFCAFHMVEPKGRKIRKKTSPTATFLDKGRSNSKFFAKKNLNKSKKLKALRPYFFEAQV
jgi:hypothetical protein